MVFLPSTAFQKTKTKTKTAPYLVGAEKLVVLCTEQLWSVKMQSLAHIFVTGVPGVYLASFLSLSSSSLYFLVGIPLSHAWHFLGCGHEEVTAAGSLRG